MRFVRRRIADNNDDVVSTVFMIAWRRLDRVPDDPRPWLFGVARNQAGKLRQVIALSAGRAGSPQDRHVVHVRAGLPGPAVMPVWPYDLQGRHGDTRDGIELRGDGQVALRLGHRDELDRVALENVVGMLACGECASARDDIAGNGVESGPRDVGR